jgi:AraC family transcriptional regulator
MLLTQLSYGRFYGAPNICVEVPGFSASLMTATVPAEDVPVHRHSNTSIIYVLSGRYRSTADGIREHCDGGTLIFNPSGTVHRDSFEVPGGRFLAITASDDTSRLINQVCSLSSSALAISSGESKAIAAALCRGSHSARLGDVRKTEEMCWDLVSAFAGAKFWREHESCGWVRRARELLQDECSTNLRLSEVAARLEIHPVYFSRAFRRIFRCTPQQYIVRCRLQKAMHLLRFSRAPLSQIAIESGFYDQSHFSRSFRHHFGVAPYRYRHHLGIGTERREVQPVQEQMRFLCDS